MELELTRNEMLAQAGVQLVCLLVGLVTGRPAFALAPLAVALGFGAYVFSSNDRYAQVPEDVQITVLYGAVVGAVLLVAGALIRRWIDAERRRRATLRS